MKKLFIISALFLTFFYSCTKDEITPITNQIGKDTIITTISDLKFKIAPIATDQFKISIPGESGQKFKLFLKKGNQELLSSELHEETNIHGFLTLLLSSIFPPMTVIIS